MERKTIGGFIAALRKANGMTQKDLAEKLNVSDKTVSRWERDDGAPDLSVIPTIAEIFGVTCDELLRGERKPASQRGGAVGSQGTYGQNETMKSEEPGAEDWTISPKAEKQRQRILTVSLSKYKTRSFIAMGISVVGLIAAMIGNFGFLRAYIGFLIGAIFYLVSVVCQAIFINGAFLAVSEDTLVSGPEIGRFKRAVVQFAEWSIGLTVTLFGASLPLVIFVYDTYVGLTAETWLLQGLAYGVVALVVFCVACYFLNGHLLKRGVYTMEAKEEQVYQANRKWKHKCAMRLLLILFVTWSCQLLVMMKWDVAALSDSTLFYDYDSFVEYMEQDIPYIHYYDGGGIAAEPVASPGQEDAITYYDQYGNEISEEEALREELTDGKGNVVCVYIKRNHSVTMVETSDSEDLLPIRTITQDQWRVGRTKYQLIQNAFAVVYGLEIVGAVLVYYKKRAK
ncbi:MAG: helix-turn-helix transcriptional regulator [Lachnospiraceae bacterium]|nr:helix-turn-helix transcriptional regulator [Lachnospiraceae bacterium]